MLQIQKMPVILYFCASTSPTPAEMAEILALGTNVRVRNGSVPIGAVALEECDGVAGSVIPAGYANYPTGREALEDWTDAMHRSIDEAQAAADAVPPAAPTPAPAAPVGKQAAPPQWTPNA